MWRLPKALELLAKLDRPLVELHERMIGGLNDTEKRHRATHGEAAFFAADEV